MANVSPIHKKIGLYAMDRFGGEFSVHKYRGDNNTNLALDVVCCEQSPASKLSSYSTIGLSDHLVWENGAGVPFGVEIAGACYSSIDDYANLFVSCAFKILNDSLCIAPGVIVLDAFNDYPLSRSMQHMLCVDPFLWGDKTMSLEFETSLTLWLQLVPISSSEAEFSCKNGTEALIELLEIHCVDAADLNRSPVT